MGLSHIYCNKKYGIISQTSFATLHQLIEQNDSNDELTYQHKNLLYVNKGDNKFWNKNTKADENALKMNYLSKYESIFSIHTYHEYSSFMNMGCIFRHHDYYTPKPSSHLTKVGLYDLNVIIVLKMIYIYKLILVY